MMEFKIAMKEMKDVIKKIEKSIPKKPSLSILETVLVKQENNQLAFIATNCDEELHIYKDVDMTGNDSFCISLDMLKKISKLKADNITVTYNKEDQKVLISTGKKIITFVSTWDAENFYLMGMDEVKDIFFVSNYTAFTEIMNKLSVYLEESDDNKRMLCCYNFNSEKNRIVALDGHRLGMCNPSGSFGKFNNDLELKEINLNRTFWIKLKNCIAKESKDDQNIVYVSTTGKKTYISGNDFMMIVRNIDGQYFNVDNIILKKSDLMFADINTKELKESAEYNVLLFDDYHPMCIEFVGNNAISYIRSNTEESVDKISMMKGNISDDEIIIGFNPRFIKDLCSKIDSEYMNIGILNNITPIMIYDGCYSYLILPVLISDKEKTISRINTLLNAA